ncbi:predicted protein [Histoplasma mississippiense (nom. inval.)]|nr:predicted protein [Histoplasma mississippiense (nom. inval.)]EDN08349.1 predicted protein [Histoplasma mississippiense (nom. inval.)]
MNEVLNGDKNKWRTISGRATWLGIGKVRQKEEMKRGSEYDGLNMKGRRN